MSKVEEAIIERVDELLSMGGRLSQESLGEVSGELAREVYAGSLGLISKLYGTDSPQAETVRESNSRVMGYNWAPTLKNNALVLELRGILANLKAEIKNGLLISIQEIAKGEILADFIILAKDAIDNGIKDVAAVLSCAALEDALKRYAESLRINVEDKDLSEVVNALKAAGTLPGPQAKVIKSFVGIRNKAMHAEWGKIDTSEIHSVIAFVQDFISKRFSA